MNKGAYACYNLNEETRRGSTSGGIFPLLAEFVICKKKGVVFGAIFDEKYNVIHNYSETMDGITKMCGSKYSQSNAYRSYAMVKKYLVEGRVVLFTGTPCQVSALHRYLNKDYDNLFTMDFVCHGVSSPALWRDYLYSIGKDDVKYVCFKDKERGWKTWYLKIGYGKKEFSQRGRINRYMRSYLGYVNIRPSCYECKFKGDNRESDFTISDCWGAGERDSEMNDNRGLSALLLNTDRAVVVFEELKDLMAYKKYDREELMEGNWTYYKSVPRKTCREDFFALWKEKGVKSALKKYFHMGIRDWIRYLHLRLVGIEK